MSEGMFANVVPHNTISTTTTTTNKVFSKDIQFITKTHLFKYIENFSSKN